MYNLDFKMNKAKYSVVKKTEFIKYRDGLNLGWSHVEHMELEYGIYTYSLEDAAIFVIKELIKYYSNNGLKYKDFYENRRLLLNEYEKYVVLNLESKKSISGRASFIEKALFISYVLGSVSVWSFNATYPLINNIIAWNGNKIDLKYSHPIHIVNEEHYKYLWQKRQYRPKFHLKSMHYALPRKRELALSHDPEVKEYLDARGMFKGNFWRHKGIRHNRHDNVPGDWKHYHKCRKQWAKNIENPSYEKLSKAVWKQNLLEEEELFE